MTNKNDGVEPKFYCHSDGHTLTIKEIGTERVVGWFDGTWHTPTPPSKNDGEEEKQWHDEPCPEDCPHKGTGHIHQRLTPPSSWEGVKELVEKMKAKYPPACNIESLEPALTQDITEIVGVLLTEQREAMVKTVEGLEKEYERRRKASQGYPYEQTVAGAKKEAITDLLTKIKSK